jgi:hypothetical protein
MCSAVIAVYGHSCFTRIHYNRADFLLVADATVVVIAVYVHCVFLLVADATVVVIAVYGHSCFTRIHYNRA